MSLAIVNNLASILDDQANADELKGLWDTLDKDGDGKVTSKEWGSKVYQNQDIMKKFFGGSTLSEIGHAFNRIDKDKNGSLTWEEFVSDVRSLASSIKIAKAMKTEEGSAELKNLWETLDKDGDGKVSSKEWGSAVFKNQEILKKYFGGSTLSEIGHAFNTIDIDNNGSLTWTEFTQETRTLANVIEIKNAMETSEGAAELKALFDTLDKDGNGKVSGKEWGSAVYKNQDIMKKYFGGSTLKEIGQTFNRINVDDNEYLTWEEFIRDVNA